MSPELFNDEILHLLKEKRRTYIIYGKRGSGKTLLLLQLMAELLSNEENTFYLSLVDRGRDRRLFKEVAKRHMENVDSLKVKFNTERKLLTARIEFLSFLLYELFQEKTISPTILIDDFFPVTILSQQLSKLSKKIPLMFVLLMKCTSKSERIFCTVPEIPSSLPLYWQALIELEPIFLRLRRGRRRRDLFRVKFQHLPPTGNKWDINDRGDIKLDTHYLASFRFTNEKLFSLIDFQ